MKRFNGRTVTGREGSCLLCKLRKRVHVFFGNLGKSTGECKNKHSDKFPKVLKIFGNPRKSSEVIGSLRKSTEKLGNVAKCSKQTSSVF